MYRKYQSTKKVNLNDSLSKSSQNLYVANMPYEGCGPMYEYPHYCPAHLFSTTSSPEIDTSTSSKPLRLALYFALKEKFNKYEEKLKQEILENGSLLSFPQQDEDEADETELNLGKKPTISVSATGDNLVSKDRSNSTIASIKQYVKTRTIKKTKVELMKEDEEQETLKVPQPRTRF